MFRNSSLRTRNFLSSSTSSLIVYISTSLRYIDALPLNCNLFRGQLSSSVIPLPSLGLYGFHPSIALCALPINNNKCVIILHIWYLTEPLCILVRFLLVMKLEWVENYNYWLFSRLTLIMDSIRRPKASQRTARKFLENDNHLLYDKNAKSFIGTVNQHSTRRPNGIYRMRITPEKGKSVLDTWTRTLSAHRRLVVLPPYF
ncbi:hypothetical protein DFJ43DRAFT_752132 [Lentinula guzmanii]|uniref:Uncharacterized protein n=1 Tax=Lentinula guzmanii TaxID=2804957 RepID=A0AA38MWH3_9AGAR|nr:hypothetical protein DFJ43DRAFT_752132 [Lentinula guzmanii]